MKPLNWATLGCGVIANELATALARQNRHLYSVANRTHEKAVAFAEKYQISKVYDRLEDVFTDPDVDIIYISTPHNTHIQYLRQALANGKHVLCEKSITLNSNELDEAIALAEKKSCHSGGSHDHFPHADLPQTCRDHKLRHPWTTSSGSGKLRQL